MEWFIHVCPVGILLAALPHVALAANYRTQPLTFEQRATESSSWTFIAHISGHAVAFGESGAVSARVGGASGAETVLRFAGARPGAWPEALGRQTGTANYFLGSLPGQWHTGIPTFGRIKYSALYPGIDLIYYGNQRKLEYDLVVAPGADWRPIRLAFDASASLKTGAGGALEIRGGSGWMAHGQPVIYQVDGHGRRRVAGRYVITAAHEARFEVAAYDPRKPLIIDPTLAFSSYLGGGGDDYAHAVAIDAAGCAYVAGETESADFPVLNPEEAGLEGVANVSVTKWNTAGTGLIYSTYIGGSNTDVGTGVAVDASGDAYVTGYTSSGNFPVTSGALRTSFVGDYKAFVLKLNPAGDALVYATLLGGSGNDYATGIAVNAAGNAHVSGYTTSVDFPVTAGAYQPAYGGGPSDGFVAKLNTSGAALVFATYLGGMGIDTAAGVALDPSGNIYVTGETQSANFPTLNAIQPTNGEIGAFAVKMSASGTAVYSTYLGGTGVTEGTAVAADATGNTYVTGFTDTADFPVTSGAYQTMEQGTYNAFVAVLSTYGGSILSATYLGGSGSDASYAIGLDEAGHVFIAGSTNSSNFPIYMPLQASYGGDGDAFAAAFNNQLTSLIYSSYLGGGGNDLAAGLAVSSAGSAYVAGWTTSGDSSLGFPVTQGAFQPEGMGGEDGFLAEIANPTCYPPAAGTDSASAITTTAAALTGSVNPNASSTQVWFEYSASSALDSSSSTPQQNIGGGSTAQPVNATVSGLLPGTTYYYQIWASNLAGNAHGATMSFATSTPGASSVSLTSSPAGASITVTGTGCSPGTYTTPANVTFSGDIVCTVTFADPQIIGGVPYAFHSSSLNGDTPSGANPLPVYSAGGSLSLDAAYAAVTGTAPSTATRFSVTAPSGVTAGIPFQFTVTALNAANQTVTSYTDPVHFTSRDAAASLPADAYLANGTGTFTATLVTLAASAVAAGDLLAPAINGSSGSIQVSPAQGLRFVSIEPCRVVDTRDATKPSGFGPPSLTGPGVRSFAILNGPCTGIPADAQAYALNVTVVPQGDLGYLTIWPTGQNQPVVSTLNSPEGEVKANAAIVPAGTGGAVSAYVTNNTNLILDINGYFVPATDAGALAFYPMTPCRLVDTRAGAPQTILSGSLAANSTTTLPLLTSSCGVPSTAQAYSLNFTLVPTAPVGFLTVWPAGESQPVVSTLNDPTGTVEANAAIAPAGTGGAINVFVNDETNLLVDINGYFAPMAEGGLSLYPLPPCRALDTRFPAGAEPFTGTITLDVPASGCGGTGAVAAYVLNATVVPPAPLGFLTLWPEGTATPGVSTLNAYNGEVTSNMAIVPTTSAQISAYANESTYLVLDAFGYFAP